MKVDTPAATPRDAISEHGWTLVPNVVPRGLCDAVVAVACEAVNARRDDPTSWYFGTPRGGGMVDVFHHPAMWEIRQHPAVYAVFRELLGHDDLWVTIDRLNMKPPATSDHVGFGDKQFVHVDIGMYDAGIPVQGVIALADTPENGGAFQCVPGLWPERSRWLADIPPGTAVADVPLNGHPVERISARAGDLIVWSSHMPHGNSVNNSDRPRFAQYVAMSRASADQEVRARRISDITAGRPPEWAPEHVELAGDHSSVLTPLGRRLAGLDSW